MDSHRKERERRDATRAAAWQSQNRQGEMQRDMRDPNGAAPKKGNLAERSKYQFEADSEDEAMEDEIDSNLVRTSLFRGTQLFSEPLSALLTPTTGCSARSCRPLEQACESYIFNRDGYRKSWYNNASNRVVPWAKR